MLLCDSYSRGRVRQTYRTPEAIISDIREVSERISEINHLLNVRKLLAEAISAESREDELRRIEALNELLDFASEAVYEMRELETSLDSLKQELLGALGKGGDA